MSLKETLKDTLGAWWSETFIHRQKHISKAPPEIRNRARMLMRGAVAGVSGPLDGGKHVEERERRKESDGEKGSSQSRNPGTNDKTDNRGHTK
ncbi:MAG: hypothetical protein K9N51_03200 [Candidatus Pacebacteria bacterium]|nr:hypothetical protein [Candidatus Paceibacterota bacterium]